MAAEIDSEAAVRARGSTADFYYPAQVVRILGLQGVDYAQLRRIFRLVRGPANTPAPRKWSRFSFREIAATRIAVELAGGIEGALRGRHLQIQNVERVCARLRAEGFREPLLEVSLRRVGKRIVADLNGLRYQPLTGQTLIAEVEAAIERYEDDNRPSLKGSARRRSKMSRRHETQGNETRTPSLTIPPQGTVVGLM